MKRINAWFVVFLMGSIGQLTGCQQKERIYKKIPPASVEDIEGADVKKVTLLSDLTMTRLGVEFGDVSMRQGPRQESPQLAIPYSALLYDKKGGEWVYVSPAHREFRREKVKVDYIEGVEGPDGREMLAFLKEGPQEGTQVVTVAATELYGTEKKIGHIDTDKEKESGGH